MSTSASFVPSAQRGASAGAYGFATARDGVLLPPSPTVRLVPAPPADVARRWDVPLPQAGRWRVLGGAGTGVSSFLIDTVLERIAAGADPAGIVVIAPSKESGARLRRELSTRLSDYAAPTTLVRSVHSLAFALLRKADVAAGGALGPDGELRLITGAEQDAVIRELLAGHASAGGTAWPEFVRPALGMVGFARQVRDFMLRAGERGLGPADVEELGERYAQPMWTATGRFMREYERVMLLSGKRSLSAAELVAQVALRPELVADHPWHTIVVDDAQLLDPNAGALIRDLAQGTQLCVVGGDPDQAVFAFRGANEEFLTTLPQQLPGVETIELRKPWRRPAPACIDTVGSQGQQRDAVADLVRRRHLEDGIAWSDIAVIVRGGGEIGQVRRTLLAAGVPVHINPTDVVLSEQRLVAAVLQALREVVAPEAGAAVDGAELEELITGPVGGADPVTLRRLVRGLRRWDPTRRGIDSLRDVLRGELPDFGGLLTEREEAILVRVRSILDAGRAAVAGGGSIEDCLWAVWDATGLATRLQAAALRGGATGSQADRDLDAMMALFDAAGDYAERYPEAPLDAFLQHITEQELPTGVRDRRAAVPDAVEVLSAHGAVGREWDTVIVVGAQEGTWPSLGETGSFFGQEDLIDLLDDGIPPGSHVSHLVARLGEERRLFHVATSRHRSRLAIVSIEQPEGDQVFEPSRFLEEFGGAGLDLPGVAARRAAAKDLRRSALAREMGLSVPVPAAAPVTAAVAASVAASNAGAPDVPGELDPLRPPVLSVPAFVASLRRVLTGAAGDVDEITREQAARQLARLADAGVPGADPEQWWGLTEPASAGELPSSSTVSPSRVEALLTCPLRAIVSTVGEEEETPLAVLKGNLAHAFLEALGRGLEAGVAAALTRDAFAQILDVPAWKRDFELEQFDRLLERTEEWVRATRGTFDLIGVEVPVHVTVADGVTIHGYIDRLERRMTPEGDVEYHVVDLKTGKTAASKDAAQDNPQLATYQLALRHGAVTETDAGARIVDGAGVDFGSGVLVYPASAAKSITTREQAAWAPEELNVFAEQLPALVEQLRGPRVTARENADCDRCPVRSLCPVRPEGRMTTHV
ncbi:ATP-dependent DNA helicase [uncultured Corynebacterium sp.]|uniref:ATP-dependent helicase n=1 Tax=uncultured Corynebacterium sp. TaxID=159447 RepID=UPI003458B75F